MFYPPARFGWYSNFGTRRLDIDPDPLCCLFGDFDPAYDTFSMSCSYFSDKSFSNFNVFMTVLL